MSTTSVFQAEERDQAGNLVAVYSAVGAKAGATTLSINVNVPIARQSYAKSLMIAFMPAGYPQSVTKDYLPYQIFDSLQAFSSSIAGLLASRAVLEGIGVGDVSANPTAAILLSILQESTGRLATILFAHQLGTSLEPECKMYRLAADIFNDAAMVLDCLSPVMPKVLRVIVLSFASCLRALCGVAAGSSKASLSAHFATQGNLGELNAKDSSQETVISLLGMLAGSVVVSYITTPVPTWIALLFLLSVHLFTNYLAVRSVSMNTLNRQRANIVFCNYLETVEKLGPDSVLTIAKVYSPEMTSRLEKVFEWDGVIRWHESIVGYCRIGVSLKEILLCSEGSTLGDEILETFKAKQYVLWYSIRVRTVLIVLKDGASVRDQLEAWLNAIILCRKKEAVLQSLNNPSLLLGAITTSTTETERLWKDLEPLLLGSGWNLDIGALETRSGVRISTEKLDKKIL